MPFYNWKRVPREEVGLGIRRRIIKGDEIMLVLWELEPGTEIPLHKHPHEQMTHVIQGRVEFKVGEETKIVGPGDVCYIPYQSDMEHGVKVIGNEAFIGIDIFYPIREDFLKLRSRKVMES
jgi:quercetin dioxygenase-like cupin family protein